MIRERDQEGSHAGSSKALSGLLLKACKGVCLSGSVTHLCVRRAPFLLRRACYILLLSGFQFPGERIHKTHKNRIFWAALPSINRHPSSWIIISFNCSVSIIIADLLGNMNSCWAHHWFDRMQEFSIALKYSKQVRGQQAKVSFLHQGLYSVYLV